MFWYYLYAFLNLVFSSLFLVFVPKTRFGILQKLGQISAKPFDKCLWIHAVSVGELNAASKIIEDFLSKYPNIKLLISTTTKTAQDIAQTKYGEKAYISYFPFDLPWIIDRYINNFKPIAIIISETELWPGLIDRAFKKKIKIIIINARISPRSFKGYMLLKPFFNHVLSMVSLICAQSQVEVDRYKQLCSNINNIHLTGNLKYDGIKEISQNEIEKLKSRLRIKQNQLVIVAGSTHDGEEKFLLDAYVKLLSSDLIDENIKSNLILIIVPRHNERFIKVENLISSYNLDYACYSKGTIKEATPKIILVDEMGVLNLFYSIAYVAFVGGSLVKIGGHNLLEPYNFAVPVLCGKYLFKTKVIQDELINLKALTIIESQDELINSIAKFLNNRQIRDTMGKNGQTILTNSQGSNAKTFDLICQEIF